jgi:hypothetical protein
VDLGWIFRRCKRPIIGSKKEFIDNKNNEKDDTEFDFDVITERVVVLTR